jgi:hypothetical protein
VPVNRPAAQQSPLPNKCYANPSECGCGLDVHQGTVVACRLICHKILVTYYMLSRRRNELGDVYLDNLTNIT